MFWTDNDNVSSGREEADLHRVIVYDVVQIDSGEVEEGHALCRGTVAANAIARIATPRDELTHFIARYACAVAKALIGCALVKAAKLLLPPYRKGIFAFVWLSLIGSHAYEVGRAMDRHVFNVHHPQLGARG